MDCKTDGMIDWGSTFGSNLPSLFRSSYLAVDINGTSVIERFILNKIR